MTDNTELKRLAEAAPEGPWFGPEYAPGTSYVFDVDLGTLLAYESIDSEKDACLRYVAAANPAAVLALIAENDRLNAENKQLILLECYGGTAQAAINLLAERDQLKAENEALESSRAKLAGELSRLRAKHKDWSVDAAMGKGEKS